MHRRTVRYASINPIIPQSNNPAFWEMVGAVRFELTTSCTRNTRASQATLRPDPSYAVHAAEDRQRKRKMPASTPKCNLF